ncbi:MAG: saccharopine dehydrogenase, partial [Calditrichia bacterium]
ARASLTERSEIIIEGIQFEEDLTSGGAADLPDALAGKTRRLDYKTLRYAGHYAWIDSVLREIPHGEDLVKRLQEKMEEHIPLVEEDLVVIYTSVLGRDRSNKLRLSEKSYLIKPVQIGKKRLRAIQATTAAGLAESARLLLMGHYKGCILQSQIDPTAFLGGPFVSHIYK